MNPEYLKGTLAESFKLLRERGLIKEDSNGGAGR